MYALIENNTIIEYPIYNLYQRFPDISFPSDISRESLPKNVVEVNAVTPPKFNDTSQRILEITPIKVNDKYYQNYIIIDLTADERLANEENARKTLQEQIVNSTQQRLDDFARTRNYDGILSACTYATSSIPKFAAEGQTAVNLRDATWAALYQILEEVQAGQRETPTGFSDIEHLLPPLEWPV